MDDKKLLAALKNNVNDFWSYFQYNYKRHQEFMNYTFNTSLDPNKTAALLALNQPTLEFNILGAPVNKQVGNCIQQKPSIIVHASESFPSEDMDEKFANLVKFLQGHLSHIMDNVYFPPFLKETYGGGFSMGEVYLKYINELSFEQKICIEKFFDCCLGGFDPLAQDPHKGDGEYSFKLYPLTESQLIEVAGKDAIKNVSESNSLGSFVWNKRIGGKKTYFVCRMYKKVYKDKEICLIKPTSNYEWVHNFFNDLKSKYRIRKSSAGYSFESSIYPDFVEAWNKKLFMEQVPPIISRRNTKFCTIHEYKFNESKIFSQQETPFSILPDVFFDGNSVYLKDLNSSCYGQMTKPLMYDCKGTQDMMNCTGESLMAQIEEMPRHPFMACIEGIPPDYLDAYQKPQIPTTLLYHAFYKGDSNVSLPPPQIIQKPQIPPMLESVFQGSNKISQMVLGIYDNIIGTNEKDVSGKTLENAAIDTNATAMPYISGFMAAYKQIAKIVLEMIVKTRTTPMTLPFKGPDGQLGYQKVNFKDDPDSIDLSYDIDDLDITVNPGVNTEIQKNIAVAQISALSRDIPGFAEFIGHEALPLVVDNLTIRGVETMKALVPKFQQRMEQKMQAEAQKQDPRASLEQGLLQVEAAKVQLRQQETQGKLAIDAAKVAIEKEKVNAQVAQIMNEIETSNAKMILEHDKVDSENARSAIEAALDISKHHHEKDMSNRSAE